MATGGISRPASATAAPASPCSREPNTTAKLTMLAPGRNWPIANASLNSCAVIQRLSSTIARRAHGSTPPNPCSAIAEKAKNSSEREGFGADGSASGDCDDAGGAGGSLAIGGTSTGGDMSPVVAPGCDARQRARAWPCRVLGALPLPACGEAPARAGCPAAPRGVGGGECGGRRDSPTISVREFAPHPARCARHPL